MARGRKRRINYWASRRGYYTTWQGKQRLLASGPEDEATYQKALTMFAALQADSTPADQLPLARVWELYRATLAQRLPKEQRLLQYLVEPFFALFGHLPWAALRPLHFERYFAARPAWGDTTRHTAGRRVLIALHWARKQGHVPPNPELAHVRLPEPRVRGREARLPAELCDLIVAGARKPHVRLLLRVLRETGCRPIELRMARSEHYRPLCLVFPWNAKGYRHKTAKTRKDRVIHLSRETDAEVKQLVGLHPDGFLFRSSYGKPLSERHFLNLFRQAVNRPSVHQAIIARGVDPAAVTPYSFRHTFISEWLDAGRSIKVCADLCGTSVAMIERVYGHPDQARLGEHYRDFMAGQSSGNE